MHEEKTKRVISIQPMVTASKEQERYKQLEAEVISCIEKLPALTAEDWGKIQFMLQSEGSLYNQAQVAKFKAVLNVLGPARNTAAWTSTDDRLAYELYISTSREALDYLIRAESILGHLEESEYPFIEDFDLDKVAKLEIYVAWLKRRFAAK